MPHHPSQRVLVLLVMATCQIEKITSHSVSFSNVFVIIRSVDQQRNNSNNPNTNVVYSIEKSRVISRG